MRIISQGVTQTFARKRLFIDGVHGEKVLDVTNQYFQSPTPGCGGIVQTNVGEARDLANAALFFLSPDADQITGQTLVVDGGWSALSPEPKSEFVDKTK